MTKQTKRWVPKVGECYFYIFVDDSTVDVCKGTYDGYYIEDKPKYCFKLKRDARAAAKKIRRILNDRP